MMYIVQRENRGERGGRERRRREEGERGGGERSGREEEERGGGERRRREEGERGGGGVWKSQSVGGVRAHCSTHHNCMDLRTQCHFLLSASSQLDCSEDMRAALAP